MRLTKQLGLPEFTAPKVLRHGFATSLQDGDGRDERPLGKLREWGLTLTQIHGGMKIGDRDTPGSRIYAEREFRESAQVLVASSAGRSRLAVQRDRPGTSIP